MADAPPPPPSVFEVPYLRLFPWLRIFRVPVEAADPKRLVLGALGVLLLGAGWRVIDLAFTQPGVPGLWSAVWDLGPGAGSLPDTFRRLAEPFALVTWPFWAAFQPRGDARTFTSAACAGLWAVVVWGLVGGAIARVAVVWMTKGTRVGLVDACRFAARKAGPLVGTPMIPLLGVALVVAPLAAFGLLYRFSGGATAAGALAFLPMVGGLLIALILIGLAAGWPLMPASVAAEAEDGFDAMSRSYAYVQQRPWQYAGYVLLAAAVGVVGLLFVDLFARAVVSLTAWGLSFGGPSEVVRGYYRLAPENRPAAPASSAHGFWLGLVGLLVRGWVYSYFWTAATAIYLLLRRDVDGTPWDAIAYEGRPSLLFEAATGAYPRPGPSSAARPEPGPDAPDPSGADEISGL